MLYTVEHQRETSAVAGPYSVTVFRHQGTREDRARAVIMYCITGIGTPEACDEKATEFAKNFGAKITTPMLSVRYALAAAEESLPRASVVTQVRALDGSCSDEGICYYPSIEALAIKARGSRHWQQGTTMVWAASATKYLILNQVAPDSCEFMVVTPIGFADVLSCQRYDQDGLTQQLLTYVERMEEEAAEH